ncbi:hypothetical protein, partial [Acetobacter indonesiensis]|uniref:hypothetical protein n=1 Tax=Acetobacter indonesiensis TaxID=104101 RepID=UPI00222EAF8F
TVDQTATEIYYSQTYDQGLTGSLPTPADLGNSGKYYYGQKVLQIFTPTGLLGTDGQAGSGYFLAALYGGGASSKVVVTGSGAKVTVNGAPALLDAGRTLNIDLLGNLTNTGSHIAAGGDMSLSG